MMQERFVQRVPECTRSACTHKYLTRAASPKGRVSVQTRTRTGGRPPLSLAGEQEDNRMRGQAIQTVRVGRGRPSSSAMGMNCTVPEASIGCSAEDGDSQQDHLRKGEVCSYLLRLFPPLPPSAVQRLGTVLHAKARRAV
jgi:hypothetical protein